MKSLIPGAAVAVALVVFLSVTSQAKAIDHSSSNTIAFSDTGKMDKMKKDKMKMDKMEKKKMDKDKMKSEKKMDKMKMKKDSSGKM